MSINRLANLVPQARPAAPAVLPAGAFVAIPAEAIPGISKEQVQSQQQLFQVALQHAQESNADDADFDSFFENLN